MEVPRLQLLQAVLLLVARFIAGQTPIAVLVSHQAERGL